MEEVAGVSLEWITSGSVLPQDILTTNKTPHTHSVAMGTTAIMVRD